MIRVIAGVLMIGVALTATVSDLDSQGRPADLQLRATGQAANGESMEITCDLRLIVVPSNAFSGACTITVGDDRLSLVGAGVERHRLPTVVLNREVIVRGLPEAGTGRFAPLATASMMSFPVYLAIDPLGRSWGVRGDGLPVTSRVVSTGRLSSGTVVFNIQ